MILEWNHAGSLISRTDIAKSAEFASLDAKCHHNPGIETRGNSSLLRRRSLRENDAPIHI